MFEVLIELRDRWGRVEHLDRIYEGADPDDVAGQVEVDFRYTHNIRSTYKVCRIAPVGGGRPCLAGS